MWKFSSQLGRRITLFPCLDYVDRGILCPHVFISIHVWSIGDRLLLTGFFHNLLTDKRNSGSTLSFYALKLLGGLGRCKELMNDLKHLIGEFLQTVPSGTIIDAHTVIEHLARNCGDAYLDGYKHGEGTASYHSRISRMIEEYAGILLTRIAGESHSENIHGSLSGNACWRRK